jgi:hypothetical protein
MSTVSPPCARQLRQSEALTRPSALRLCYCNTPQSRINYPPLNPTVRLLSTSRTFTYRDAACTAHAHALYAFTFRNSGRQVYQSRDLGGLGLTGGEGGTRR